MLSLTAEPLTSEEQRKLREWLADPQCLALIKAVNAEAMLHQAEHSDGLLRYPMDVIVGEVEAGKSRTPILRAARLTIFLEVLEEMTDVHHGFVRARVKTEPNP